MSTAHNHKVKSFGNAFAVAIFLNALFVIIEAGYGFKINSLALLADAGHNLSDVAGLLLAWAQGYTYPAGHAGHFDFAYS